MRTFALFAVVIAMIGLVVAIPTKTWCQTTRCSTGGPTSVVSYINNAGNASAFVVSNDGSYCESTDWGNTWTYSSRFANQKDLPLWWAQYSKSGQILISGDNCRLFLSTNNATSFTLKTMPCLTRAFASAFSPSGGKIAVTDNDGWLYVTSDGGNSWVGPTLVPGVRLNVYFINSLSMPDESTVVMVGGVSQSYVNSGSSSRSSSYYPFLVISTDGGVTSRSVTIPSSLSSFYSWAFLDVSCKGGRCLMVGTRGLTGRYVPGETPQLTNTFPYSIYNLEAVYCTDDMTCYVGGSGNLLALTTDFGGIWTLLTNTQPYSVGTIQGIYCANEEYCFAASDSGLVFSNSGYCATQAVTRPVGSGASVATLATSVVAAAMATTVYFIVF